MKPRNMPGRKFARRSRADERRPATEPNPTQIGDYPHSTDRAPGKGARANAHPTIADMCWRISGKNRDAETGVARSEA